MNSKSIAAIAIAAVLGLVVLFNSVFIVNEAEQALVLQFGRPVRVEQTPGLKFKTPFVQEVYRFDKRLLEFNAVPQELIAADKKRLIVDAFVRYRIVDPLAFYQSVRNEAGMVSRLNSIVESGLRQALSSVTLPEVLSAKRAAIMLKIRDAVNREMAREDANAGDGQKRRGSGFGIKIVDVRIMRADLPQENSQAIYSRMQTEREREAKEFRAQGAEEAQKIRAGAEKERTIMLAEAKSKAEMLRGEGDAEASRIYANAFNRDPKFFDFYRSMQAYRKTLGNRDTTLILSPDSGFLREFDGK